ncbi:MAG: serine/threonine protein phosphatase [Ruminococcaceae bacterium]|nr:serine/threonine protein phosphatase [Oscillospiraceae bacterium]
MALFVISDLHLDILTNEKSMEVFGNKWSNYTERLKNNWKSVVSEADTVIIPGDISWALTLEESIHDLKWINDLPGKKILMKGNHDFWWSSAKKMRTFFDEKSLSTLEILHNGAVEVENYILAGSRGWFVDKSVQPQNVVNANYDKVLNREKIRLKMSLEEAKKIQEISNKEILAFFHFPPIWSDFICEELISLLKEYGVSRVYFGHIHGVYNISSVFEYEGIKFKMISADFIDFLPQIV